MLDTLEPFPTTPPRRNIKMKQWFDVASSSRPPDKLTCCGPVKWVFQDLGQSSFIAFTCVLSPTHDLIAGRAISESMVCITSCGVCKSSAADILLANISHNLVLKQTASSQIRTYNKQSNKRKLHCQQLGAHQVCRGCGFFLSWASRWPGICTALLGLLTALRLFDFSTLSQCYPRTVKLSSENFFQFQQLCDEPALASVKAFRKLPTRRALLTRRGCRGPSTILSFSCDVLRVIWNVLQVLNLFHGDPGENSKVVWSWDKLRTRGSLGPNSMNFQRWPDQVGP